MENRKHIAVLISRLIIGGIFIMAGYMKLSDMAITVAMMGQIGISAWLVYVVAWLELIGGVLIVIGAWTCIAAAVLSVIMLFAIYYSREGMMWVYPLAVLGGLVNFIGTCGGKYAVVCCCKPKNVGPTLMNMGQ